MSDVIFLLEVPTPQRTPALNEIARHGVDLVALYFKGSDVDRGWGELKIEHCSKVIPDGRIPSAVFIARRILRSDARVLCCFGYGRPAYIIALLLARAKGIQVVVRSDSNYSKEAHRPFLRRHLKRLFLRVLYGTRARVWTIGRQNELYWRKTGLKNRHLIPYGVPRPPVGNASDRANLRKQYDLGDGPVLLSVSMLETWKGLHDLLWAFRELHEPNARLLIVGKGSLENDVRQAVSADARIRYIGPLENEKLGAVYAAADVLVLASHYESWGLVVNEAQANGLPVLVSDAVGAAADLVSDSTGWTFPAGDREGLLTSLSHVCGDDGVRIRRMPPVTPYNAAPAMLADLHYLGVPINEHP